MKKDDQVVATHVVQWCARLYGVSTDEMLLDSTRAPHVVAARWTAIWILRNYFEFSYPEVARAIRPRKSGSHSSVVHAEERISDLSNVHLCSIVMTSGTRRMLLAFHDAAEVLGFKWTGNAMDLLAEAGRRCRATISSASTSVSSPTGKRSCGSDTAAPSTTTLSRI